MRHGVAHDGVNKTLLLVSMAGDANLRADVIALGLAGRLGRDDGSVSAGLLLSCAALRETVIATALARAKINRIRRNDLLGFIVLPPSNVGAPQISSVLAQSLALTQGIVSVSPVSF